MDALFTQAVSLLDAGDVDALARLIDENPRLVRERTDFEGHAYFHRPYLLWFVAENPVRNDRLPPNIADVTRLIIDKSGPPASSPAVSAGVPPAPTRGAGTAPQAAGGDAGGPPAGPLTLQEQLDYALALVSSGRVPREAGVQRALIDVLCDGGASPDSAMLTAVAHQEIDAIEQLLARGATLTLTVAAALGLEIPLDDADAHEKQRALTAAAFYGNARAVERLVEAGADVRAFSPDGFHPHATPLHQAVHAGSLDSVRILVEAGAPLDVEDRAHHSTPLGWAEYLGRPEIASYLREQHR
ncbi:MAG TPA: ankyrin repeat domain-containing protein [Thermoanaerobaculia bacterium]